MTTSRPIAAALLFMATTATVPALAGCPTIEDRAGGIVLAQNEPFFMRSDFKASPEGFFEQRVIETGGQAQSSMALYRHGLVMSGEHNASGHVEITYVDDLAPLRDLPEKGTVSISGVAKGPAGEAYVELELQFMGEAEAALGECRYETWQVRSSLRDRSGAGAVFDLDYAPAIDLVLAARQVTADGNEVPVYAYSWIGTADDIRR